MRGLTSVLVFFTLLWAATAYHFAAPDLTSVNAELTSKKASKTPEKITLPKPYFDLDLRLIRLIHCSNYAGTATIRGTAWVFRKGLLASAAHVASDVCIDHQTGQTLTVIHSDKENDFALLSAPDMGLTSNVAYSCEGFKPEERYLATGWRGGEILYQSRLRAEWWVTSPGHVSIDGSKAGNLRFLSGNIYKGMSGGPVFDDYGVAVGINSATDSNGTGFSRDLRDTIMCDANFKNPAPK